MKNILFLALAICLLSACNSGKHFTSRKYTKGRYVSHSKHKGKVEKAAQEQQAPVLYTKAEQDPAKEQVAPEKQDDIQLTASAGPKVAENSRLTRPVLVKLLEKNAARFDNTRLVKVLNKKQAEHRGTKTPAGESRPGTKSILSVILSATGIIMDIVAIASAVITLDAIFLGIAAIGAVFGVLGLVFGLLGISEYRKEKRMGNKDKKILVLGIIGTAMGGVVIYLSLVAFYLLLLLEI